MALREFALPDLGEGLEEAEVSGWLVKEGETVELNPPQGAILGLGVIGPLALVVEGGVVARPACTLSLTYDHRLLDGAAAGRALGDLVNLLESRERLEALRR